MVRQRHCLCLGKGDVFCRRPEGAPGLAIAALSIPEPDPLTNPRGADAIAHGLDRAGTVAMRDHDRMPHLHPAPAGAALHIRRIDPGGRDADQHLTRCR